MLEALLGMCIVLEHMVEGRPFRRVRDLLFELVHALLPAPDLGCRIDDLLESCLRAGDLRLLLEVADRRILREGDCSLIRRLQTHEDLQEGGLACSVRADKRPALASIELQGSGRVENAAAE